MCGADLLCKNSDWMAWYVAWVWIDGDNYTTDSVQVFGVLLLCINAERQACNVAHLLTSAIYKY